MKADMFSEDEHGEIFVRHGGFFASLGRSRPVFGVAQTPAGEWCVDLGDNDNAWSFPDEFEARHFASVLQAVMDRHLAAASEEGRRAGLAEQRGEHARKVQDENDRLCARVGELERDGVEDGFALREDNERLAAALDAVSGEDPIREYECAYGCQWCGATASWDNGTKLYVLKESHRDDCAWQAARTLLSRATEAPRDVLNKHRAESIAAHARVTDAHRRECFAAIVARMRESYGPMFAAMASEERATREGPTPTDACNRAGRCDGSCDATGDRAGHGNDR